MTLTDTPIQIVIFWVILLAGLGFITWYRLLLNINSKRNNKTKRFINKLTTLAIFLIWLIGLNIALMVLGFITSWYTFDTFLWALFEIVLLTSLGMLFITSMVIVHSAKRQSGKGQGDDINEHFSLLAKHLIAQMKFILVVTLLFIVKRFKLRGLTRSKTEQ